MIHMGQKLKSLRLEHNFTMQRVATRIGVSNSAVSSYENSYRYPSYATLRKLARLYRVSTDYLLGMTECRYCSK